MKKKVLSLLLTLCLVMTFLPMAAFAAEAPLFSGGTGTQEDPWLITSQEDLIALAEFLNSGNAETFDTEDAGIGNCYGYYFKQTADIDLTGVSWEPIGYSGGYYFAGNYDGDGHSITNAVSTGKVDPEGFATAGIFGWVAFGSVENLHVKNANFSAIGQNNYSYVGGIAGVCYGSSIENCSVVNSSLESKRNNNNNCAGSIVGYSTGGTFEKCAAENNQVKTMAYGGGFVGEVDDDPAYGAGKSTFTNCYTANCSVSSKTDDVQGVSLVGGFAGEMTDSALTVKNCYVYRAMLSTEGTAVPGIKATGVFAGHLWGDSSIVVTNCFFGACGITENAGAASEKTEEEFRNGTVAGLLGEAFAQVDDYPKINGPADYTKVDAAIAKANALKKDDYKDFSAVVTAVHDVVPGKTLAEQGEVDAMAKAIEDALAALQYKDADYTKVDAAIAKANALNKDDYKDFTAVEAAVNAVVRDKNITEQSEVDAMAKAIEDAIAALQYKDADYAKVDAAIAKAIPLTTSVNSEFWIAAQKAAIRNGMMNEDKQQMLASIGVVYGQFKRSDDWQENYNFVKAYYEQHKQLPVGVNSQQMSTGSLSGFWIGLQRKKLKDNALSAERVSLLKEIGIEYGQFENSWNANYNAVKAFFDEHHHLPVQDASILLPSGIQSRNWITNQKKFLKAGNAPEDRVKLLNDIGIVAEADAPKPSKSKSEKVKKAAQTGSKPSRKVSKNPAEDWQECYDFVKRCLEESGTLPTGEKSTTMPNGVQTKSWIKQQRKALKESGMPADKEELLSAIGIVGNLMEQNWMRDYECIKEYVEEHHQLPVYKNSFELPDGGQSAQWIANRRTQMRNGTMPEERVKMLADIGIVYGRLADNWKESYNAIKAYLDEHGELPLKEASITLPTGSQSHWWIRNQTLMLHQGRQSEDKVKLLNEIGIV